MGTDAMTVEGLRKIIVEALHDPLLEETVREVMREKKARGTVPGALEARRREREENLSYLDQVALGDTRSAEERIAEGEVRPVSRAVSGTEGFAMDFHSSDIEEHVRALTVQLERLKAGDMTPVEEMLFVQANSLDLLFNSLTKKAGEAMQEDRFRREGTLDRMERLLRLALKAQMQSAQTLRTLGEIRNPRSVAFVKQLNAADQQIVNNGTLGGGKETGIKQNELSQQEGEYVEVLEPRGTKATGGADPVMVSMESQHRTPNSRRKK